MDRHDRWKTVHPRVGHWGHASVWERVFKALTADRNNPYRTIDGTVIHAHQQVASGEGPQDQALGRSL